MSKARHALRIVAAGLSLGLGLPALAAPEPAPQPALTTAVAPAPAIAGVWRNIAPTGRLKPADGRPLPFTAKGRKLYAAHVAALARGDHGFDASATRCTSPGQPRLLLMDKPFAIFVEPRLVTMQFAWNRLFRQIKVGTPLRNPYLGNGSWSFGTMQGQAQARWQGDSLEVRTDTFAEGRLLDDVLPSGEHLSLVEHIRAIGPDRLEDRITITDPEMFTRPWQVVLRFGRLPDSALPFAEDVCIERLKPAAPQSPERTNP